MSSMEVARGSGELSVAELFNDNLSDADYERARELHAYVTDWVLENLPLHGRALFMHLCAKEKPGDALALLYKYFADVASTIPPSEATLWVEWAMYWLRGFRPNAPR